MAKLRHEKRKKLNSARTGYWPRHHGQTRIQDMMMTSKMIQARALESNEHRFDQSVLSSALRRMQQISDWWRKRRARLHLMAMDDYLLKDIGISRSEIYGAVNMSP
jgi:uncharacterized protein YjiS (DUF1127 family)